MDCVSCGRARSRNLGDYATRRALEINQIIRDSEIFPRIRDAEKAALEDEVIFRKRREKKRKKREKLLKEQQLGVNRKEQGKQEERMLPTIPSATKIDPVKLDYFSAHVLNRDPNCSQYMPFNEVFFPKLFNLPPDANNPHSIDLVWMLGFQHNATHVSEVTKTKKEFKS